MKRRKQFIDSNGSWPLDLRVPATTFRVPILSHQPHDRHHEKYQNAAKNDRSLYCLIMGSNGAQGNNTNHGPK